MNMRGKTARRLRKAVRSLVEDNSRRELTPVRHRVSKLDSDKVTFINHSETHRAKYQIIKRIWKSMNAQGKIDFWNPAKS